MSAAVRPTRRVTLLIDGQPFEEFVSVEISRSLTDMSGTFNLVLRDAERAPVISSPDRARQAYQLGAGRSAEVRIDNEAVLIGWVDALQTRTSAEAFEVTLAGRDRAGDLVDCAAAPDGPMEYLGLTALDIARRICQPFGIPVSATADVGQPFARYAFEPEATALEAIEKACRARALLPLSDGLGGLVLTRGGTDAAPDSLHLGVNLVSNDCTEDYSQRFSRYVVKGQAEKTGGSKKLDGTASDLFAPAVSAPAVSALAVSSPAAARETEGTALSASVPDATIRRYRPTVIPARTESSSVTVRDQALWAMRQARGRSLRLSATVTDWRGATGGLWRPNQLVRVVDPSLALDCSLLIESVSYRFDANGTVTALTLVGPEAYDLLPEEETRKQKSKGKSSGPLDGKAQEL
jgi:prophage tail gpP-like protein